MDERTLREIYRILIPDGFFIGAMFAASTLHELREVMETAEQSVEKVLSLHVSPLPTPGSIGDALSVAAARSLKVRKRGSSSRQSARRR